MLKTFCSDYPERLLLGASTAIDSLNRITEIRWLNLVYALKYLGIFLCMCVNVAVVHAYPPESILFPRYYSS